MSEAVSKKILIVEDEQELASGLAAFLKSQGYSAIVAYDGLHGVSQAHKEAVDLVILDLGLPAGGGLSVLENIKKSVATNHIPVLVLTANPETIMQDIALKLGAAAYLLKPFEPEKLLGCIKDALGNK